MKIQSWLASIHWFDHFAGIFHEYFVVENESKLFASKIVV